MRKLTAIVILLVLVLVTRFILKNESSDPKKVGRPAISMNEPKNSDCIPYEQYLYEHPGASDDELLQADQCSKARATRLGLDKPNTGFLGNTHSRPKGALAHYKVSDGGDVFTVYDNYILASTSDEPGDTEILFSRVFDIKQGKGMYPRSVLIEYITESGSKKAYAFMLMSEDDSLKAEGATDLDRLIALLKKQRNKHKRK